MTTVAMMHPRPAHCGNCHGLTHDDDRPLMLALGSDENWGTETTGQVFSAQPIRLSALNLRDKDRLGRAWDVHAQRLVECRDCHYALAPPDHLPGNDAVLVQADREGGLRACTSCHTDGAGHDWLPQQETHFSALSCEACHVPQIHMPARRQVDASMLTTNGKYLVGYRGLEQGETNDLGRAFISGYRPLLLQQRGADGTEKWAPMNLVTRWYWMDGETGKEVGKKTLGAALLDGKVYRHRLVDLFDGDGDAHLDTVELRLDSKAKVDLVRSLLAAEGVTRPELRAELRAYHLHHNVALRDANRDCSRCHEANADARFVLADYIPGDTLPSELHGVPESVTELWEKAVDGGLVMRLPGPIARSEAAPKKDP